MRDTIFSRRMGPEAVHQRSRQVFSNSQRGTKPFGHQRRPDAMDQVFVFRQNSYVEPQSLMQWYLQVGLWS